MNITTAHHVDSSELNHDGGDYYYEYDLYAFSDGEVTLNARAYTDQPNEAHFLSIETQSQQRLLKPKDLRSTLFAEAVAHLRNLGKTEIHWLSGRGNGYEPI